MGDKPSKPEQLRIACILLAAGASERMGVPKQTLLWRQKNLVNTCLDSARLAGLEPIVLVLGAHYDQILLEVEAEQVRVVHNSAWAQGQSSSIRAGLEVLPDNVAGAVFMLVDQPQISVNLLKAVMEKAGDGERVVLPIIAGRRANPVYFPKCAFPALMRLEGDQGGRAVISDYPITYLEWLDETMALDVDTLEDYAEHRRRFALG